MTRAMKCLLPTGALALAMVLGACTGKEPNAVSAGGSTQAGQPVVGLDSTAAAQNAILQEQKDSLFGVTRSLLAAMASIDSATAAAGVKPGKDKGEPIAKYEEGVRDRTLTALKRLRSAQARLHTISARVDALGGENSQLKGQIDTFRSTVSALQTQLASSQLHADSLVRQLYAANLRGDSLEYRTKQLGYTIDSTNYENRRVFVVTGTADYLVKHGIVKKTGGTRFPFIVKIGQTIRPANTHPDTTLFRAFDMMALQTVPVDSTRPHEVVSSQDLSAADNGDLKGRVFSGAIHITNPKQFWRSSPYLILVEP